MRLSRALLLCLLLAGPARADDAPIGPQRRTVWTIKLRGKTVGSEQVSVAVRKGRRVYSSRGKATITKTPFEYTQRLEVDAQGRLIRYGLTSTAVKASAARTKQGATIEAVYTGNKQGKRSVTRQGPYLVLDTLTFSHYECLGRLAVARKKRFRFTSLTPQALTGLEATFTPGELQTVAIDGTPRSVRKGALAVGKLRATLFYDQQDGRAYRVEDSQGYVAHVAGWPAEPWRELEVSLPAPRKGLDPVPGTLTLPRKASGKVPTLLFLCDAGPQDRDESVGPNKPFRDLARGLARRGIASLRCDKRSFLMKKVLDGGDQIKKRALRKEWLRTTFKTEYVDDARVALDWLAKRPEVGEVFLLAHGFGARAVPEVAAKRSDLGGAILLAAAGRPRDELVREEAIHRLVHHGKHGHGQDSPRVKRIDLQIRAAFKAIRAGKYPPHLNAMGYTVAYWRDLLKRPLLPVSLAGSKLPILLLHGDEDFQVRVRDFDLLEGALRKRSGVAHKATRFKGLNHLFMKVKGESTGADYEQAGTVAPEVVEAIAAWVAKR